MPALDSAAVGSAEDSFSWCCGLLRLVHVEGATSLDRQLSPTPAVLAYILKNMDRSFDAASDIVAELDRQSMSTKRPITRAMAATVMA